MKYSKGKFGIFFFLGDDKIMVSYKERKINGLDSSRQWFLFFFVIYLWKKLFGKCKGKFSKLSVNGNFLNDFVL